jgi:hypothetical protein
MQKVAGENAVSRCADAKEKGPRDIESLHGGALKKQTIGMIQT